MDKSKSNIYLDIALAVLTFVDFYYKNKEQLLDEKISEKK